MNPGSDTPILIGDPDRSFLHSIESSRPAQSIPPVLAASREELEQALAGDTRTFLGMFLNPKIADNNAIPFVGSIRTRYPSTPLIFLCDTQAPPLDPGALGKLSIARTVSKPANYQGLMQALGAVMQSFDPKAAIEKAAGNRDKLDEETVAREEDFVPILARNFVSGAICYFDVYVRLREGKYVKVLMAGDGFSPERLRRYLEKGVLHFYLRKEAQEQYVRFCDKLASAVIAMKEIPVAVKTGQLLNQGRETEGLLRSAGLDEAAVGYAQKYVENVRLLISDKRIDRHEVIRGFLTDIPLADHGAATAAIAALLAAPLGFEAQRSVVIVGMSAYFHDIGLLGQPDKLRYEDLDQMSPDEVADFHKHPKAGFDTLAKIPEINPTVLQAVLQHHERRSRSGFPDRLGAGQINRVAEIVALSEEFVHLLNRVRTKPSLNPGFELDRRILPEFSTPVATAFKTVFAQVFRQGS